MLQIKCKRSAGSKKGWWFMLQICWMFHNKRKSYMLALGAKIPAAVNHKRYRKKLFTATNKPCIFKVMWCIMSFILQLFHLWMQVSIGEMVKRALRCTCLCTGAWDYVALFSSLKLSSIWHGTMGKIAKLTFFAQETFPKTEAQWHDQ